MIFNYFIAKLAHIIENRFSSLGFISDNCMWIRKDENSLHTPGTAVLGRWGKLMAGFQGTFSTGSTCPLA